MTKIVAVAGKGGVGKTSLAGAFVKVLVEKYPDKKILAIDACLLYTSPSPRDA